ncbi:MAG: hypothetical protein IJG45_05520 [Oscillospiraceae bacterium]|nr:hypothetical protein [Oscillospiraceae bacterium]
MQKHKILSFLLALVVSIGLWVYAVTVVNPDDSVYIRDVRVRIIGTSSLASDNLMLTGGENQTVNVEISGRRSDLKELNSSSLEALADVSNIDRPGTYEVSWTLVPPSTVASGDISIVSTNSNKITVKVSEYNDRPEIPVEVEYTGTLPDGYIRDDAVLDVETVSVSGPAEEVNQIARAILTVDLDGATDTIDEEMGYRLVDQDGNDLELSSYVQIPAPTVRVSVPVFCYKQIALKVNLIPGGGATDKNVELTIEPSTIVVSGSEEALQELEELVIKEIDLAQITEAKTWTVTPDLPVGVTNRASAKNVTIKVSLKGLSTRKIVIPCADFERVNDVETMTFGEPSVTITVRGTAAAIAAIRESDIQVIADMTNGYDASTKKVTLEIILPENSTAGIIGGPYLVTVTTE